MSPEMLRENSAGNYSFKNLSKLASTYSDKILTLFSPAAAMKVHELAT